MAENRITDILLSLANQQLDCFHVSEPMRPYQVLDGMEADFPAMACQVVLEEDLWRN